MNEGIQLELDGGRLAYSPGQTLAGTVAWELPAAPQTVAVRLLWYTSGKGDQDVGVVDAVDLPTPAAAERRRFTFQLPEGPHSFSGQLISLQWAVEATADPAGATTRVEIVVAPRGEEKRLPEAIDPMAQLSEKLQPLVGRFQAWSERRRR